MYRKDGRSLQLIKIQTDQDQRELSEHGSAEFPLTVNHDHLYDYFERYICCHWHEEFEIPVVIQGYVRYQLKDQSFDLHAGEGIVINSRVPHSILSLEKEEPVILTTIFLPSLLYGTPASRIYQKLVNPYMNTPKLSGILLPQYGVEMMKQIDTLYREAPFGMELQIKGMLCSLFSDLLSGRRQMLSAGSVSNEEALSRLKILLDLIHKNYADQIVLSDLARAISVSRESCCRFFKSMTGKTIFQYLEDYRVTQGILLLQDDKYSVTQVSYLVGFGNPGRFSAAFAKRMNCTPSQYRQRNRLLKNVPGQNMDGNTKSEKSV